MGVSKRLLLWVLGVGWVAQAFSQGLAVSVRIVRDPAGTPSLELSNDSPVPVRVSLPGIFAMPGGTVIPPGEVALSGLPKGAPQSMPWTAAPASRTPAPFQYLLPYVGTAKVTQLPTCLSSHAKALRHAVDFALPMGTPVRAARDGTVLSLADGPSGPANPEPSHQIQVLHADGTWAVYGHLLASSYLVTTGQFVQAGDLLAYSGNSGNSTGPHLHFAVHYMRNGTPDTLPIAFTEKLQCGLTFSSAFTP